MAFLRYRRRRAGTSFALLLVVAGLVTPIGVLGHAELVTATPADGATVTGPPTEIVLLFSENLDPGRSTIRLVDAGGTVIAEGGRVDLGDDVRTMRLALPTPPPPGSYTIRWTSFSTEDGERHTGTTTFRIAAPTPPPASAPPAPSAAPSQGTTAPPASSPTSAPTYSHPPTPAPPAASAADAVLPIVAALAVLVILGTRFLRGRTRRGA